MVDDQESLTTVTNWRTPGWREASARTRSRSHVAPTSAAMPLAAGADARAGPAMGVTAPWAARVAAGAGTWTQRHSTAADRSRVATGVAARSGAAHPAATTITSATRARSGRRGMRTSLAQRPRESPGSSSGARPQWAPVPPTSSSSTRPDGLRRLGGAAAVAGVAGGLAVLAARRVAWRRDLGMAVSAATPYLLGVPLAAGVVAAAVRRPWLAASAVATAGLLAGTQLPRYVGGSAPAGPWQPLRIATSNLKFGQADPGAVMELVREGDVDVLFVQELTAHGAARLERSGPAPSPPARTPAARPAGSRIRHLQPSAPHRGRSARRLPEPGGRGLAPTCR